MKNQILHILIMALFFFGCSEKSKEGIEIINVDLMEYQTDKDFIDKERDKPARPVKTKDGKPYPDAELLKVIKSSEHYSTLRQLSYPMNYNFRVFVSEIGTVDKIVIIKSMGKELDALAVKELSNWKFEPAVLNGIKVKYRYDWEYDGSEYFKFVEEMPKPIGGIQGIAKLVRYPEIAKRAGIQGRVFVKAFLSERGNVMKTEILKGIGAGCDEAAMEAVKKTKFVPAKLEGEEVKSQVVVPILFKLN